VALLRLRWREISVPHRLLMAAALAYAGVFVLLVAYGRPGLGVGEGFFVPVILAAAATSAPEGALAGVAALLLYEIGIHQGTGLAWRDFATAPAATRFASYVAAGLVVGYLGQRFRQMLAQSLVVLDDLIELAHGRIEELESLPSASPTGTLD
jgi:hypothetical protein